MQVQRYGYEWERQAGESARAFKAFLCYLEVRSHKMTAQLTGNPQPRIYHWSCKYRWQERACAYDAHCFEQQRAESSRLLHTAVPKALQRLLNLLEQGDALPPQVQVKVAECILRFSWLREAPQGSGGGGSGEPQDPLLQTIQHIQRLALTRLQETGKTQLEGVE